MKLIVEKENEYVKAIKVEYTPAEALVINHAMRRYACDSEVNEKDRAIMKQMLDVKPLFVDVAENVEDLGDYPDTIQNQFDNMTGSMNL